MAGSTRSGTTTVAGKRVRAPSSSPPRISEGDFQAMLRAELGSMEERVKDHFTAIIAEQKKELDQIRAALADVNADRQRLQGLLDKTLDEVAQLKGAAESRDRASRASHLIIKGLPEESNGQSVLQAVSQLFPAQDGETPVAITEARRLGRPREAGPAVRPRAVLVKFTNVPSKHAALKHSKALRSRQIYLDSDLTPQQRELRAKARDRFQQLKAQQMKPFWREERLFYYQDGRIKEDTPSKATAMDTDSQPTHSYATAARPN